MNNQNNAAQTAEQDPLSDDYINHLICLNGYDSPEAVIARLWQWIGLNGGENSVTLLIYEAHKALSKLRAEGVQAGDEDTPPIAPDDEAIADAWIIASDCDGIAYDGPSFERGYRAALASAPVAGEAVPMHRLAVAALNGLLLDIRAELGLSTTDEGRAILDTTRALKTQAVKGGAGSKEHQ